MQGGQHQVAGERGLHRDLRGLEVADFADHDDVRVLTQDRAQGLGKGHVDPGIDLGLTDAFQVVLDRILDRHDIDRACIDPIERRIERGGFSRTGRPGHQHDAMRLMNQPIEVDQGRIGHAELGQIEPAGLLLEQTQHRALAVPGWEGRDPNINRTPADAQRDAAVLGQAFLGNIEARHDLDPRDQRGMQLALGSYHIAQRTIDPKAHHRIGLEGLDMDV